MVLSTRQLSVACLSVAIMTMTVSCSKDVREVLEVASSVASQAATESSSAGATGPTALLSSSMTDRWNVEALTRAFDAINARIAANPADYLKVVLTHTQLAVQAVDPNQREHVDEYTSYGDGDVDV